MVLDNFLYPSDLLSTKSTTIFKSDRIKPKFRCVVVSLNTDMRRLITITRIKEKAVRNSS